MADQFGYPGMQQPGQAGGYAPFHYPSASGDQNAQLLSGYALSQQDMQHFDPLMANAFGPQLTSNGDILQAIAQQQGLPGRILVCSNPRGFNPAALFQDPSGGGRGAGNMSRGGQRGGLNKFGGPRPTSYPSVTNQHEFLGRKIEVKQATNSQRPVIIPPGMGAANAAANSYANPMFAGPNSNPAAALAAATIAAAASGNTLASLVNNSPAAAANFATLAGGNQVSHFDDNDYVGNDMGMRGGASMGRGGRGAVMSNGRSMRGTGSSEAGSREGDWSCTQCGNINFSWRDQCNRCHVARASDGGLGMDMGGRPGMGGSLGRGGMQMGMPQMGMGMQHPGGMPGYGRGGGPMMANPVGRGGGIARGGGPMRGTGMGAGRARPAPY